MRQKSVKNRIPQIERYEYIGKVNPHVRIQTVTHDSLYAALSTLNEFELFEPDATKAKSLFDLMDGVMVVNLSGYDESIQNLVVALTLDLFYSRSID